MTENQEVQRALMKLARQISHDLRSPLLGLGAKVSVLDIPKEDRAMLNAMISTIERVAKRLSIEARLIDMDTTPAGGALDTLYVPDKTTVVILDDEVGIHILWDDLFRAVSHCGEAQLVHLSSEAEFREWVGSHRKSLEAMRFLVDFDLGNSDGVSGIELIKELRLQDLSTLVTGHAPDPEIQSECRKLGMKLIDKAHLRSLIVGFYRPEDRKPFFPGGIKND